MNCRSAVLDSGWSPRPSVEHRCSIWIGGQRVRSCKGYVKMIWWKEGSALVRPRVVASGSDANSYVGYSQTQDVLKCRRCRWVLLQVWSEPERLGHYTYTFLSGRACFCVKAESASVSLQRHPGSVSVDLSLFSAN